MYCAHCGKELADDANFCTACGSRSAIADQVAAAAELTPGEPGGVSAALASGRSRSRLRMSPLVLLVLALALTAGIAAAAYYVYTEVYLPNNVTSRATSSQNIAAPEALYMPIRSIEYDQNGSKTFESIARRDARGAEIERTSKQSDGSSRTVVNEYDENGYVTTSRYDNGIVRTYTNQLDEQGRLVERKGYFDGSWSFTTQYTYASTGAFAVVHFEDSDGSAQHSEYDAYNYPIFIESRNADGTHAERHLTWHRSPQGIVQSYDVISKRDDGSVTESHFTCEVDEDGMLAKIYDSTGALRAECEYVRIDYPYPAIAHEVNLPTVIYD